MEVSQPEALQTLREHTAVIVLVAISIVTAPWLGVTIHWTCPIALFLSSLPCVFRRGH